MKKIEKEREEELRVHLEELFPDIVRLNFYPGGGLFIGVQFVFQNTNEGLMLREKVAEHLEREDCVICGLKSDIIHYTQWPGATHLYLSTDFLMYPET